MSYLAFEDAGRSDSGKTLRINVRAKGDDALLGLIAWHGPWRRYTITFRPSCVFDPACLTEIAARLEWMTKQHRDKA